jgi:adenylate cyclase
MTSIKKSYSFLTNFSKYKIKTILYIALFWTLIDTIVVLFFKDAHLKSPIKSHILREVAVFIMSGIMGYLFVYTLKNVFRNKSILVNFLIKSLILLVAAFTMNFLVHFVDLIFVNGKNVQEAFSISFAELTQTKLLIQKILYWLILFAITQLYIDINEKYSPGVFLDIVMGKYLQPQIEKRIIMFIDLKDSTPIAEKLGHVENFKFIRDFIHHVSMAIIEHDGRIYQYVGDEVVVSWLFTKSNVQKCMASIIEARKNLQKNGDEFRRKFDIVPEFRVGIHMGEVTVGEIGVIKKDLAMSGDTMNTTARIRSACNELNQKFIMSKDFRDQTDLEDWQGESLGLVDLKGKSIDIELFSLKV